MTDGKNKRDMAELTYIRVGDYYIPKSKNKES